MRIVASYIIALLLYPLGLYICCQLPPLGLNITGSAVYGGINIVSLIGAFVILVASGVITGLVFSLLAKPRCVMHATISCVVMALWLFSGAWDENVMQTMGPLLVAVQALYSAGVILPLAIRSVRETASR